MVWLLQTELIIAGLSYIYVNLSCICAGKEGDEKRCNSRINFFHFRQSLDIVAIPGRRASFTMTKSRSWW